MLHSNWYCFKEMIIFCSTYVNLTNKHRIADWNDMQNRKHLTHIIFAASFHSSPLPSSTSSSSSSTSFLPVPLVIRTRTYSRLDSYKQNISNLPKVFSRNRQCWWLSCFVYHFIWPDNANDSYSIARLCVWMQIIDYQGNKFFSSTNLCINVQKSKWTLVIRRK